MKSSGLVCGECGCVTSEKYLLKKHIEAVHENNRRERNTHAILHTQSSINLIMALMIEGDIEGGQPSMKSMIDIIIPTLVTAKLAPLVGMGSAALAPPPSQKKGLIDSREV